jgi:ribose 5-phosphate isomerase B
MNFRKILIASDHAAFQEKKQLMKKIEALYPKLELVNLGTNSAQSVNYPDQAKILCEELLKGPEGEVAGILLCGSGIGVSIMANKFKGIRAALCWNEEVAQLAREHNHANVLCMGARLTSADMMMKIFVKWFTATPGEERHALRVGMLNERGEVV